MVFSGRPQKWRALRKVGRALTLAGVILGSLAATDGAWARRAPAAGAVDGSVVLAQLPPQAQATYRLILAGGPFASRKDASVFGNFERSLPSAPRGFYREYTVATPGARNRGARRIVCGGEPPTAPSACYYTADHYASFQHIVP